mgnify:CR=1 FL=1
MDKANEYLAHAQIRPVGEAAVMVSFGDIVDPDLFYCAQALSEALEKEPFPGLREFESSYTGVTIFYDPLVLAQHSSLPGDGTLSKGYREAKARLEALLQKAKINKEGGRPTVRIPVCYGGEFGPDLDYVAEYHHMTPEDVIRIHSGATYLVYMIGFAPGYPYMGGLPEEISTPRRKTPRLKIPKGTVALAGSQAGVYPLETPGGWQLLGRTPLELFHPEDEAHPTVLQAGDKVQFYAITLEEYKKIAAEQQKEGAGK